MKLSDLFEQIETLEFSLNLSVLSGFKSVLFTLERDETVQRLTTTLQNSPENVHQVFQRLLMVLSNRDHSDYILFSDEALTTYLYALHQVDIELANQAAEQVSKASGLWWARRLANHILQVTDPAK